MAIPVAGNDTLIVSEDAGETEINWAANDSDSDGHELLVLGHSYSDSAQGTVWSGADYLAYSPAGLFDYLAEGETAIDTFDYKIRALPGNPEDTAFGTVTVTITGVNDAPTAAAASDTVDEDGTVTITPTIGDVDDGDVLTISVDSPNASVVDDSIVYTASGFDSLADGETTTDTFTYTVTDAEGETATSTVTVTIVGANDAPTAGAVSDTVDEDGTVTITPDVEDPDASDVLTISVDSPNASVVNDSIVYTASGFDSLVDGETAIDTFTYTVTDSSGETGTASVTVTITGANDAPQLVGSGIADEARTVGADFSFSIADDFEDLDAGDTLTFQAVLDGGDPLPDWLSFSDDGTFTATEPAIGSYAITVIATDGAGATVTDTFTLALASAQATSGDDILIGGTGNDTFDGGAGAASIDGGAGADTLWGGAGNDTVLGGTGDDLVYGNMGADLLYGGDGGDLLYGGQDGDTVAGGGGDDVVYGNLGADLIYGDAGNDLLYGGQDDDAVYGGSGNDAVYGNLGEDVLHGDDGDDLLYGGQDDDTVYGGGDADIVYGNRGDDVLYGDEGDDVLYGGQDNDVGYGGDGADMVYGNLGNDTLYGDLGADMLYGGREDDLVYGGDGDDTLVGGVGDDVLSGGEGADLFVFAVGSGADSITDFDDQDVIELRGFGFASTAEVLAAVTDTDDGALLDLGDGDSVLLLGLLTSELNEDGFLLV